MNEKGRHKVFLLHIDFISQRDRDTRRKKLKAGPERERKEKGSGSKVRPITLNVFV